jgi:hypothetical protein
MALVPVGPVLGAHIQTCVFHFFFQGKQPHWTCQSYATKGSESFICINGNEPISLEDFKFMSLLPAFKYPSVMVILNTMSPPGSRAEAEPILTDNDYKERVITVADFEDDILECWTEPA